jgi:hypothetical protein
LLFPISVLNTKKKYYELPQNIKNDLGGVEDLNHPFDMVNAFERAWLNKKE